MFRRALLGTPAPDVTAALRFLSTIPDNTPASAVRDIAGGVLRAMEAR